MIDYGLEGQLKQAFEFLSSINKIAYEDLYLLSNEVLSKNPSSNNFLRKFIKGELPERISVLNILLKLSYYYAKSFVAFGIYLFIYLANRLSRLKYTADSSNKELIIIDTFFLVDRIIQNKNYSDIFFAGFHEALDRLDKKYVYLPVFYSTRNPFVLFKVFRILKKNKVPVLSEYQLLLFEDFIEILRFIYLYPFKVLRLIKKIKGNTYEGRLLKSELFAELSSVAFFKFSRFLQGRRISQLISKNVKVISWFENHAIDKNLYKGLRVFGSNIKIYGAQPFLISKNIISVLVDENETRLGIVPDKIIVNGTYLIPKSTTVDFCVGPSFRYKKIFSTNIDRKAQKDILVLLPYFIEDTMVILNLLQSAELGGYTVKIKVHPSNPPKSIKDKIPFNSVITEDDIYVLFKRTKIVIGASSGTLVEAAGIGIPVISIKTVNAINYNTLPIYGQEIIWSEVTNSEELEEALLKFEVALKDTHELNKIDAVACEYKKMFFCIPTDENIIKAYDLYD